MNYIDIDSSQHELYDSWRKLYTVSFPIFEQRMQEQQEKAFSCADYHLVGYSEGDMFVGFISYWEFSSYRYIEHFAVHQGLRGRGYGSEILNAFLRSTSKVVLLEIDPVVDSVSRARLRFYRKCGFHENPFAHTHPPYREGYPPHSLVVLTSPRSITENEYRIFSTDLTEVVMQQG